MLLQSCSFDEEPRLYGARTRGLTLSRSHLPGLHLSDARVDGLLLLNRCHFGGTVRLTGTRVTETLSLKGAELRGDLALQADSLAVGRNMVCADMAAYGECIMESARVSGTLTFCGARLR